MNLDEMPFRAGNAFNNQETWKESLQFIKDKGGFIQKFVRQAVENKGFNIFDSYCKFSISQHIELLDFRKLN